MASGPYLMNRKQGCFRSPLPPLSDDSPRLPRHDPNCTTDKYTDYFRGRWNILRQDVCNRCPQPPFCPIKSTRGNNNPNLYGPNPVALANESGITSCTGTCIPYTLWDRGTTQYRKAYDFPWSPNNVDDCCKAECPCEDEIPKEKAPGKICRRPPLCPPLDSCTTYKHFYQRKPTPLPSRRHRPDPYDPCECPLESATSYRLDYEPKEIEPNGTVLAKLIKHGMWSNEQMNKQFTDDTETKLEFIPKCGRRRSTITHPQNLKCGPGHMRNYSETITQFGPKTSEDRVPYPEWIHKDTWLPPETALERCTTYKHFYKPFKVRPYPGYETPIRSPDAIPFSSMNNMWYTCCDPVVDQRTPVELKDNDPWPRVITLPVKYEDNLKPDPCAPFRDDTTYKADYYAKQRCASNKWYGPCTGYTPPILPFIDNTTNRVSYVAYPPYMMKDAKQNSGNPNGIKWGPYKCPPETDKCKPPFPAPYGHPLKPYTGRCPCGKFDDRSMYHQDFKFRTEESVELEKAVEAEREKGISVPKGLSLYRADYSGSGGGKKAEKMPPPVSKGERCMRPCSYHDLDSLYKLNFRNFWKELPYERVDKYRGHPSIKIRRPTEAGDACQEKNMESIQVFQMPPGTTVEDTLKFLQK